jgi:hypothetical protein
MIMAKAPYNLTTAPYEHFLFAEAGLSAAQESASDPDRAAYLLARAQIHATLATVDAAVWDAAKREADAASAEAGESK